MIELTNRTEINHAYLMDKLQRIHTEQQHYLKGLEYVPEGFIGNIYYTNGENIMIVSYDDTMKFLLEITDFTITVSGEWCESRVFAVGEDEDTFEHRFAVWFTEWLVERFN